MIKVTNGTDKGGSHTIGPSFFLCKYRRVKYKIKILYVRCNNGFIDEKIDLNSYFIDFLLSTQTLANKDIF